jgi:2-oxoglutarate ferredoxin oxidoreductase subunit alpha
MEVQIRIAGAAGQGIQTAADLLGRSLSRAGSFVYLYNDAESRIRGGLNFSHLRCSDQPLHGISQQVDILVALTDAAVTEFAHLVAKNGIILCNRENTHPRTAPFTLASLLAEIGNEKALALLSAAIICALLDIPKELVEALVRDHFGSGKVLDSNLLALELGYRKARDLDNAARFRLAHTPPKAPRLWLAGHESVALGAIAGGVRFVASYPMSPSTGTLTDLADWAHEASLVVEQAEDEIAAINMVAGASYAGARAMTTTSGGGFCLMTEGVSLLGMIEVGGVILIAQRPGPATGLPTRTAQGDLRLALHAGHGAFAKAIFAPKNLQECYELTARAFDVAERFGCPVFVLTDQLLQDSQATMDAFSTKDLSRKRGLLTKEQLEEMSSYRRYELTDSGVSPQAAPGISQHVVVVDSDEHDMDGHLTEKPIIAEQMAHKRLRKIASLKSSLDFEPVIEGQKSSPHLVISWGSSYETLKEARNQLKKKNVLFAHLHLSQVWPLPEERLKALFAKYDRIILVENNVVPELGALLCECTLRKHDVFINRFDGRPFSVEEMVSRLTEVLP